MAHFDGPKYVEVHQRSPALGSKLGSNVGNKAFSIRVERCEGRVASNRASLWQRDTVKGAYHYHL